MRLIGSFSELERRRRLAVKRVLDGFRPSEVARFLGVDESRILRHLREKRGLSMRKAAKLIGRSVTWINHLENGRVDIRPDDIRILLPLYKTTEAAFRDYAEGKIPLPRDPKQECLDLLAQFNASQIQTIEPVLRSIAAAFAQKG